MQPQFLLSDILWKYVNISIIDWEMIYRWLFVCEESRHGSFKFEVGPHQQLGAAANFDDLVKFGDRRQIRRSQMFIKLAFEFGCDVILMSYPITRSLGSKLRQFPTNIDFRHEVLIFHIIKHLAA